MLRYWVACKVLFKPNLADLSVVETAKFVSQTTQSSDQADLRHDNVDYVTKPRPLGKFETSLSLTLRLSQWITRRQKIGI